MKHGLAPRRHRLNTASWTYVLTNYWAEWRADTFLWSLQHWLQSQRTPNNIILLALAPAAPVFHEIVLTLKQKNISTVSHTLRGSSTLVSRNNDSQNKQGSISNPGKLITRADLTLHFWTYNLTMDYLTWIGFSGNRMIDSESRQVSHGVPL